MDEEKEVEKIKDLNHRQTMFCKHYLATFNATKSAKLAGYSEKTAGAMGHELLKNPKIEHYIKTLFDMRADKVELTSDYILTTIIDTVERCRQSRQVFDRNGFPIMVETPTGELAPAYVFDAKNVLKGAELLGKHKVLFTDKVINENRNITVADDKAKDALEEV